MHKQAKITAEEVFFKKKCLNVGVTSKAILVSFGGHQSIGFQFEEFSARTRAAHSWRSACEKQTKKFRMVCLFVVMTTLGSYLNDNDLAQSTRSIDKFNWIVRESLWFSLAAFTSKFTALTKLRLHRNESIGVVPGANLESTQQWR